MNPYVVPVTRLLRHVGTTLEVGFSAPFDPDGSLAAAAPGAAEVVPGADVEVRLVLTSFLGGVAATGTLVAPWRASCRRCATSVHGVLDVQVAEQFRRGAEPDDEDAYPLVDEQVDLFDLVRDAIVLELPLAPLCRQDCAGLCPHCGTDRNEDPCACRPDADPRWATLDALRVLDQA
jgi:DUF177 domain-containing protein